LRDYLQQMGIHSGIHYPVPCHQQPACAVLGPHRRLPVTESAAAEILSLPMFPELCDEEVDYIADAIGAFFAQNYLEEGARAAYA
jgi:dTDP-4-amino-4,6-dideoxygalactose transaminase